MQDNKDINMYNYPKSDLLNPLDNYAQDGTELSIKSIDEYSIQADRIVDVLKSFGIDAVIKNIVHGLHVIRYEIELGTGVELESVTNHTEDIELHLGVENVRIAPIPDKNNLIGIGILNSESLIIPLRELIESPEFSSDANPDTVIIGRRVNGQNIVTTLSDLSHLLIVGSEGSGKTVFLEAFITSTLYKASPGQLKLIMIDAKMIDLPIFSNIPHLLFPLATEKNDIIDALGWVATEIDRRHDLLTEAGICDFIAYNKHASNVSDIEVLPRIAVIIDHLALLSNIQQELIRIISQSAQNACNYGIHLVISTQQPEADIIKEIVNTITPSRVAFYINTKEGSQAILGTDDANKLNRCGDMLYLPVGLDTPMRVHGCYLSENEVSRVVSYITQEKD